MRQAGQVACQPEQSIATEPFGQLVQEARFRAVEGKCRRTPSFV
jgi:hypothetical protein